MFGEFVPFSKWLPFLKYLTPVIHLFTPGQSSKAFHIPDLDIHLFPLICFEDVMSYLTKEAMHQEVDFILNLTNDGWFKESAAQFQHASLAAFRSIETGLPMIRCGNNGLTCWIDPTGQRHGVTVGDENTDVYGRGFRVMEIPKGWHVAPAIYRIVGDLFAWMCLLVATAVWLLRYCKSHYKREPLQAVK